MIPKKVYVGVDNGLNGAIVGMMNGKIILKTIMPTTKTSSTRGKVKNEYNIPEIAKIFRDLKEEHSEIVVALEKALIIPISGRQSIASTSLCFGMMRGILTSLKIPYNIINPKVWQKRVLVGMDRRDTKIASANYCANLFPEEDFTKSERARIIHDGLTDALCMAKYCELEF